MPISIPKENASVADQASLTFESPVLTKPKGGSDSGPTLEDLSGLTKTVIRAEPNAMDPPFGQALAVGDMLLCGQRPGEWLAVGEASDCAAFVDGLDRSGHVSVIDHTHSRAMFRLSGSAAPKVLEKICSLDWSDAMTPTGAVVSASVAKVTCDIARVDSDDGAPAYLIACDRSFGQYLFDAIADAGSEFDLRAL